jgi:hypothetical protein
MAGASPARGLWFAFENVRQVRRREGLGLEQERKLKLGDVPTERRKELQSVTIESLIEWYRQDRTLYPPRRKGAMTTKTLRCS